MNILFYTGDQPTPTKGGTERTTITVASSLTKLYSWNCYSMFTTRSNDSIAGCFKDEHQLTSFNAIEEIRGFIEEKKINVIINQNNFELTKFFRKAIGEKSRCKLIFGFHFQPGYEKIRFGLTSQITNLIWRDYRTKLKSVIKIFIYPIYKLHYSTLTSKKYKETFNLSDYIVLLSSHFIPKFNSIINMSDNEKIKSISNGLSFPIFLSSQEIKKKKKKVLIVSRLAEPEKRISAALKVWRKIQNDERAQGWSLDIVGDGQDRNLYCQMINKYKLRDVNLLGRKDPLENYKESSIFMMTSSTEGWGLTLTEAQQFGVVPIAFDTYESLKDIITDGKNGIIIPANDIDSYSQACLRLMEVSAYREELARNGIQSCKEFTADKIAKKWHDFLISINE